MKDRGEKLAEVLQSEVDKMKQIHCIKPIDIKVINTSISEFEALIKYLETGIMPLVDSGFFWEFMEDKEGFYSDYGV